MIALFSAVAIAQASVAAAQETDRIRTIEADPAYVAERLRLENIPAPSGPAVSLFNGRDLADWETWLGYPDPSITYRDDASGSIGAGKGLGTIFKVVEEDGAPALYVNGKTWGSIVHKRELSNYHLSMEYKWGPGRHPPRLSLPPNNGLLYHSNGAPGSVFGTWMPAVEFEIMLGSTGMVVPVGKQIGVRTNVGTDKSIEYPHRRYLSVGREVRVEQPAWNVEAGRDAEHPPGVWNRLDLYVVGNSAIHVVNGVPVMVLRDLSVTDPASGDVRPLTSGRIQFQSEGAETFFRDIRVEPIETLPRLIRY